MVSGCWGVGLRAVVVASSVVVLEPWRQGLGPVVVAGHAGVEVSHDENRRVSACRDALPRTWSLPGDVNRPVGRRYRRLPVRALACSRLRGLDATVGTQRASSRAKVRGPGRLFIDP